MRPSLIAALGLLAFVGTEQVRAETEARPTEATSVSCGQANRGALANAAQMPAIGPGFLIVEPWLSRNFAFGTDELVGVVQRAAEQVATVHDGAVLGVGDLSDTDGGAIAGHRSHQSGRDVDLIYYAVTRTGEPMTPDGHMAYYRSTGRADYARSPRFTKGIPVRYFDKARNWELVKALATDAKAPVARIFVSWRVRTWLLEYAEKAGEPEDTVEAVRAVLKKPRDAKAHNDHMHVRIGCTKADQKLGACRDKLARKSRGTKWHTVVPCPVSGHPSPRS